MHAVRIALTQKLSRGKLERSVTLFYKIKRAEVEPAFSKFFTAKSQTEFDLEYGVHLMPRLATTNTDLGTVTPAEPRENSVPTAK